MEISLVINDLRQFPIPVSGYTAINRSASACSFLAENGFTVYGKLLPARDSLAAGGLPLSP